MYIYIHSIYVIIKLFHGYGRYGCILLMSMKRILSQCSTAADSAFRCHIHYRKNATNKYDNLDYVD